MFSRTLRTLAGVWLAILPYQISVRCPVKCGFPAVAASKQWTAEMDRRHSVPNYLRSSRIVGIPSILFTLIALFSAVIPSRAQGPGPCDWPSTCSLWTTSVVPGTPAAADSDAVNLGVKFRTAVNGYVTGIRFYKGATNTGTHIVSLW